MTLDHLSNIEHAQQLTKSILDDLEIGENSISPILLKIKRLARLLHDSDAQKWLDGEIGGYSSNFDVNSLGGCKKYFRSFHTFGSNNIPLTLPSLEFTIKEQEKLIKIYEIDVPFGKFLELKKSYDVHRLQLHNYVIEVHLSLLIGDVAEDIFQNMRESVDIFLQENCEKDAKEKLLSINDRLKENNKEAYSQALLSCRRILMSVADSIFPSQNTQYKDRSGKFRDVGIEKYNNRILAYIEQKITSESNLLLIDANINHLADRLEAINDQACKGVHAEITKEEANLTIIQMYLLIAEIARIHQRTKLP